jgi:hypothetical protein
MPEFWFDPPVMLSSNVAMTTLAEAMAFMRSFRSGRRPLMQAGILRRLEAAVTEAEQCDAATGFCFWAKTEGLMVRG